MLRRFSVFSLAFLLCLSLFPARALAWDVIPKGVLYQGDIEGSNYGAVVSAYNQFDAACYVMGKDPNTISASIKLKLSDANYGGKFYEYSQSFFTQSGALENVPGWVPTYVVMISELGDLMLSDYQSVWYSSTTKALHDAALSDFARILNGEDLGGGGGSSSDFPTSFTVDSSDIYHNGITSVRNYGVSSVNGFVFNFNMSTSVRNYVSSYIEQYPYLYVVLSSTNDSYNANQSNYDGVYIDFVMSDVELRKYVSGNYYYIDSNGRSVPRAQQRATLARTGITNVTLSSVPSIGSFRQDRGRNWCMWVKQLSNVTPPPSGTWPEPVTPAAPVAPVLPEPAEPVVETPVTPSVSAPSWPDVTINIDPDPTPGTTPSGLDYTELLTRINDNLISIDSFARAINSNLNSLRSDLLAEFNGVIDSLRNIYNYLLTIDSVLETHCMHLRNKIEQSAVFIANYMRTLIKWLADQLDFDDLTNVDAPDNSLLTTINEKLGGGTYEPNPIKDESGYYQWLDDLWDRFLLGDNWQSSMGSISGSFSELKTRFPFSVPWDIVALFRLFVHDPVTPVFDLPLYFSPDGSTPVHVDLSPWDSVASLVRPMIFVIFALKLALLSRDLLGGLGADKGGL